jgi:hypothetical protein
MVAIGAPPAADEELEAALEAAPEALEAALLAPAEAEEMALDADSETDEAALEASPDREEAPLEAASEADETAAETEVRPLAREPEGPAIVVAMTLPAESVKEVTTPKMVEPVTEIKLVTVLPSDTMVE